VLSYHPDKTIGLDAEEIIKRTAIFKGLVGEKDKLSNAASRAEYDGKLREKEVKLEKNEKQFAEQTVANLPNLIRHRMRVETKRNVELERRKTLNQVEEYEINHSKNMVRSLEKEMQDYDKIILKIEEIKERGLSEGWHELQKDEIEGAVEAQQKTKGHEQAMAKQKVSWGKRGLASAKQALSWVGRGLGKPAQSTSVPQAPVSPSTSPSPPRETLRIKYRDM